MLEVSSNFKRFAFICPTSHDQFGQ